MYQNNVYILFSSVIALANLASVVTFESITRQRLKVRTQNLAVNSFRHACVTRDLSNAVVIANNLEQFDATRHACWTRSSWVQCAWSTRNAIGSHMQHGAFFLRSEFLQRFGPRLTVSRFRTNVWEKMLTSYTGHRQSHLITITMWCRTTQLPQPIASCQLPRKYSKTGRGIIKPVYGKCPRDR